VVMVAELFITGDKSFTQLVHDAECVGGETDSEWRLIRVMDWRISRVGL